VGAAPRAQAEEAPHDHVELAADLGLTHRPLGAGGVHSAVGLAYGAHFQILAAPWLRITPYYLHAQQGLRFDRGALGTGADVTTQDRLTSYVLGLRVQPTWNATRRLHLWLNAGAGWGVIHAPGVHVAAPSPFDLEPRDGVWLELPFGVGGVFDIVPNWMGVALDAVWGPVLAQTGDAFDGAQAINASAQQVHVGGMPKWSSSLTIMAALTLRL
jgi:hypothetical protein